MTEPLQDSWNDRDLPVLREAARRLEQPDLGRPSAQGIGQALGMPLEAVELALSALESDGLVTTGHMAPRFGGLGPSFVRSISGDARRQVGLWPTPRTALDRMLAALEAIAENTDADDDTRTNARRFRDWLKASATTVGIGVATATITGQLPGH